MKEKRDEQRQFADFTYSLARPIPTALGWYTQRLVKLSVPAQLQDQRCTGVSLKRAWSPPQDHRGVGVCQLGSLWCLVPHLHDDPHLPVRPVGAVGKRHAILGPKAFNGHGPSQRGCAGQMSLNGRLLAPSGSRADSAVLSWHGADVVDDAEPTRCGSRACGWLTSKGRRADAAPTLGRR